MKRVHVVLTALILATGLTLAAADNAEARNGRTAAVVGGVIGGLALGAALSGPAYAYGYDPYYYDDDYSYANRVYYQPRVYGYYYQPRAYRYYGYPRYTRSVWHDRPAQRPCWWCW